MTTDRPCRGRLRLLDALRELDASAHRQFDPAVVVALFRAVKAELRARPASPVFPAPANGARRRQVVACLDRALGRTRRPAA